MCLSVVVFVSVGDVVCCLMHGCKWVIFGGGRPVAPGSRHRVVEAVCMGKRESVLGAGP